LYNNTAKLFSNEFRTAQHDGRDWLIIPGVPVREQVMKDYLLPKDEIAKSIRGWNGIPLSINHPQQNGGSVNVPAPDVAIIGKFYNAKLDGARMVGEYWIDSEIASHYAEGQAIVEAIKNGMVIETSTGYYADDEAATGEFEGKHYATIHRNLLPDHIAILPAGIRGACSVADGCGVNRNNDVKTNCGDCNSCPQVVYDRWVHKQDQSYLNKFAGHKGRPGKVGGSLPRSAGGGGALPQYGPKGSGFAGGSKADAKRILDRSEEKIKADREKLQSLPLKELRSRQDDIAKRIEREQGEEDSTLLDALRAMEQDLFVAVDAKEFGNSNVHSQDGTRKHPVLKNNSKACSKYTKEIKMDFTQLQAYLGSKGIEVVINEGDDNEFTVEERTATNSNDTPALDAGEIEALKALAGIAPKLSALNADDLDKLKKVDVVANFAEQFETRQEAIRNDLVTRIKLNAANTFTDDELSTMPITVLEKMEGSMNVNYGPMGATGNLFENSDVLVAPSTLTSVKAEA